MNHVNQAFGSSIYAKRYTINHITLRDMPHIDESRIGLTGSPTRVRKVYQPPLRGKVEMLSSIDEGAKKDTRIGIPHQA